MGYYFVSSIFITVVAASAAVIVFYHGLTRNRTKVVDQRHHLILALEKREKAATKEQIRNAEFEVSALQKYYNQAVEEYNRYLGKFPHRFFAWILGIRSWGEENWS